MASILYIMEKYGCTKPKNVCVLHHVMGKLEVSLLNRFAVGNVLSEEFEEILTI